ncbi:MAG: hypothetical protein PVI00_16215 [Desulfobacterales bacterium]
MKKVLVAAVILISFLIVGTFNPLLAIDREPDTDLLAQQSEDKGAEAGLKFQHSTLPYDSLNCIKFN